MDESDFFNICFLDVIPDLFMAAADSSKKFGRVVAVGNNEMAKKGNSSWKHWFYMNSHEIVLSL